MYLTTNISAYILCGGLSSRMNEEKGLVIYNDQPFISHIIEAVLPITKSINLVTKNPDYSQFGYPLVSDIYENKGPVGGIYTALKHSETELNLILSCDVPNINAHILKKYLINSNFQKGLCFLETQENRYPLIGLYSKSLASIFNEAIQADTLRLREVISQIDYKTVKVDQIDEHGLLNINNREDLQNLISLNECI